MRNTALAPASAAPLDGVRIDRVSTEATKLAITTAVQRSAQPPLHIATVNLDFLALARRHPPFREALLRSGLAVADGMPLLWLSRMTPTPIPERVTGADLTMWLVTGGIPDARLYLLAGSEQIVRRVSDRARHHGVVIAGGAAPPRDVLLSAARSGQLVDDINRSGANILLAGLGAPLQELWIARWQSRLSVAVAVGVGGSLAFLAGDVNRAPRLMQNLGLEWLYRLAQEPTRLWKRYLLRDIPYVAYLFAATVASRVLGSGDRPPTSTRVADDRRLHHEPDEGPIAA